MCKRENYKIKLGTINKKTQTMTLTAYLKQLLNILRSGNGRFAARRFWVHLPVFIPA